MKIVLIGGGHAHLYALSRLKKWVFAGGEVTVIAPGRFWYSGMGPGLLGGAYREEDDTIDIESMVTRGGGRFIAGHAVRIDAEKKVVELEGGESVAYDLLSLNVGSGVAVDRIPGAGEAGVPVKPVENFGMLRDLLRDHPEARVRLVVIGAGAAGCETVANAASLLAGIGKHPELALVSSDEGPLAGHPARAQQIMRRWLKAHGVACRFGARADRIRDQRVVLSNGDEVEFDYLVLATGVTPSSLLADSDLPVARDGSLCVDEHLRCVSDPDIQGGGDCIAFQGVPLERVGVYAVRQGPILFGNVLRRLKGQSPRAFHPQKHFLLVLNLGDGTGLLMWRGLSFRSAWAWRFKNHLDRSFIRRFQ